jgi:RNA polymerase sigma factor (sigma-70 family)
MTTSERSQESGTGCGDGAFIAEVLCRARAGDQAAIGEIVQRCSPMLRALARRTVHDDAEVEDVLQEVWITFVENLERIREPAATRAWLVRVLTHAAIHAAQRARRTELSATSGMVELDVDTADVAVRNVWLDELRERLDDALKALRPEDRRLVVLLANERRPDYRSISQATGRPIGSIGPTRMRAMDRLRRQPSLAGLDRTA